MSKKRAPQNLMEFLTYKRKPVVYDDEVDSTGMPLHNPFTEPGEKSSRQRRKSRGA